MRGTVAKILRRAAKKTSELYGFDEKKTYKTLKKVYVKPTKRLVKKVIKQNANTNA